uniref:Uncharacterized protein n=1 Tax=Leptosiphonia brodiei TaxID=2608611 RepID=A0A1Z1MA37_9FLOR|nr:hypothetical protein [Leptosiphonia brodiei]ARW62846.1 hypothetical protein [Leptosiphonia brodiei]
MSLFLINNLPFIFQGILILGIYKIVAFIYTQLSLMLNYDFLFLYYLV